MNKFCPGSQEIKDPEERKQFLIDNADKVVEIDYHKSFDSDEMAKMKTEFAEKHIRIATLEENILKLALTDAAQRIGVQYDLLKRFKRRFCKYQKGIPLASSTLQVCLHMISPSEKIW